MNIRSADFAFLRIFHRNASNFFYSLSRKFSFSFNYFSLFFIFSVLRTTVHDFGLNRCEVEAGLN